MPLLTNAWAKWTGPAELNSNVLQTHEPNGWLLSSVTKFLKVAQCRKKVRDGQGNPENSFHHWSISLEAKCWVIGLSYTHKHPRGVCVCERLMYKWPLWIPSTVNSHTGASTQIWNIKIPHPGEHKILPIVSSTLILVLKISEVASTLRPVLWNNSQCCEK